MRQITFKDLYIITAVLVGLYIVYRYITSFDKNIVVKEKWVTTKGENTYYHVVSTDNNVYLVSNDLFTGTFDKSEMYSKLIVNHSYNIKGKGMRIKMLGMYPKIHDISKL